MLRKIGVSLVGIVMIIGLGQLPAEAAGTTPVPFPTNPTGLKAPVTLPSALDPTPLYQPQTSCNPVDMVGPLKLRQLVLATYKIGGAGNISRGCTEGVSEHSEGRAWDWMVDSRKPAERAAAADFLAWVTANHGEKAKRLGIMYVIYNQMIWGAYREADGWRPSYDHIDHIHVSFSWNGARANTSFWTGRIQPVDYGPCANFVGQPAVPRTTPRNVTCGTQAALVKKNSNTIQEVGSTAASVKTAQAVLGVTKTGVFDSATWAAVKDYQNKNDLPVTGALDIPTWGSLRPTDVTSDVSAGYYGKTAAAYGRANYSGLTLVLHSTGKPVLFAQVALGMWGRMRNGYFGANTVAVVKNFQLAHGLPQTGNMTKVEWNALAAS